MVRFHWREGLAPFQATVSLTGPNCLITIGLEYVTVAMGNGLLPELVYGVRLVDESLGAVHLVKLVFARS